MSLKLSLGRESKEYWVAVQVVLSWDNTIRAEEPSKSMDSFNMLAKAIGTIEASRALCPSVRINMSTLVRCELKVVGVDMTLKRLMLPEGLVAWRIGCTSEPVPARMSVLVSLQSSRSKKALSTPFLVTYIGSIVGMGASDMCLEVLVVEVCLVTTIVGARKRSVPRMSS